MELDTIPSADLGPAPEHSQQNDWQSACNTPCHESQIHIYGESEMTNILKLQKLTPELTANLHIGFMSTLSSMCPINSGEGRKNRFELE